MLLLLYRCVLRMHPLGFRRRFGDEMLSIFEQSTGKWTSFPLLLDATVSLLRQWTLRPEFWNEIPAPAPQPALQAIPSFFTLEPFRPRAAAVVPGVVLSMTVFCLTCFAIKYSWIRVLNVRIPEVQFEAPQWIPPSPTRVESAPMQSPPPTTPSDHQAPSHPATVQLPAKLPPHPQTLASTLRKLASRLASPNRSSSRPEADVSHQNLIPIVEPESRLQIFAGSYEVASPAKMTISIEAEDGYLTISINGQARRRLAQVSPLTFEADGVQPCTIEFLGDAANGTAPIQQFHLSLNGKQWIAKRR